MFRFARILRDGRLAGTGETVFARLNGGQRRGATRRGMHHDGREELATGGEGRQGRFLFEMVAQRREFD